MSKASGQGLTLNTWGVKGAIINGALQLIINRYGYIHFAHEPERILIKSFFVLIIGNFHSFSLSIYILTYIEYIQLP